MIGGAQSMRPLPYFTELFRLADAAGLLRDPGIAVARMHRFLAVYGVGCLTIRVWDVNRRINERRDDDA